jgi:hypothetical protein
MFCFVFIHYVRVSEKYLDSFDPENWELYKEPEQLWYCGTVSGEL